MKSSRLEVSELEICDQLSAGTWRLDNLVQGGDEGQCHIYTKQLHVELSLCRTIIR